MRIFIFLPIFAVAKTRVIENCSGISIHGINHEKEVLKEGLDSPYQLAIDYDTNYLFFSYSTPHDMNDGFKSAYINLKTNEFNIIRGIPGGFANAVDSKNHIVYLGGNNGIYQFDFNTNRAKFLGARNTNIWQLFYKDQLYFTDYPSETASTFDGAMIKYLPELQNIHVTLLAVDKHDDIWFSNSTGLYIYKKGKSNIVNVGDYTINGFTTDLNKNIYFSTPEGIYAIKEDGEVEELASIENVYGIAIEADSSIIYANGNSIIRLKPTKERCFSGEDNKLE